ncbi:hypothetical protein EVAR_24034_1 [Eumeta japonica]|uniref:Zinc finger BED domain-containing protein 4 n=1 Tax=Eumeta variegata TaxID=151549 RepID=A0A4C1W9R3_EUMVA|nr:hypothetical protein EVAR_24034_1 [Eumeta japonica]
MGTWELCRKRACQMCNDNSLIRTRTLYTSSLGPEVAHLERETKVRAQRSAANDIQPALVTNEHYGQKLHTALTELIRLSVSLIASSPTIDHRSGFSRPRHEQGQCRETKPFNLKRKYCVGIYLSSETDSKNKRPHSHPSPKPSTSKTVSAEEDIIPKKKIKKIDSYFKKENSMETMVSRMADMIIEFKCLKKQGKRFSLSFDEWTSQKNHRYLNLNVHHKEKHFNLGIIRIHGSCTAEHTISLIENRLKSFGLDSNTDIIGMSTDGASVIVKVGRLMNCYQQLCYAHDLQLAVVDVLYKKRDEEAITPRTNESDTDDEDIDDDALDEQGVTVTTEISRAEVIPKYRDILQKVRKVVKLFKRSPTKYDMHLQKYVKEDTEGDSTLLTAETTLKFILDKLLAYDTVLSNNLSNALRARITERRSVLTGIIIYLQNPKKYQEDLNKADNTFTMPKKKDMRLEMKKILERVHEDYNSDDCVEVVELEEGIEETESLKKDLTLQEELQLQLQQEVASYTIQSNKKKDFDKILKKGNDCL